MTRQPIDQLFTDALDVVNRTLEANRGEGLYGTALELIGDFIEGHRTVVSVYKDDPDAPFDAFTLRYRNGRFEKVERGKGEHDSEWKVSREYLESLVNDPDVYIEHPARLDLDWLASRVPEIIEPVQP